MESKNRIKIWLVLLACVLMASGILANGVMATPANAVATGKCTNAINEGIEYFIPTTMYPPEANEWRKDLHVEATKDGADAGAILAMELEIVNSGTRYQCTELTPGTQDFSCNSFPTGGVVSGIYFLYSPTLTQDDEVKFSFSEVINAKDLLVTTGKVSYPAYPCARNILLKDFVAPEGQKLIINTSTACTENKSAQFLEQKDYFAMVNNIPGKTLEDKRFHIEMTPANLDYDYKMDLVFEQKDGTQYTMKYEYKESSHTGSITSISPTLDGKDIGDLPLILKEGKFYDVKTTKKDLWGNDDYPTNTDFNVKFWYENDNGTQGYENAIFHFERNLHIEFAPYCTKNSKKAIFTGKARTLFDPCVTSRQLFIVDLIDENNKGIDIPATEAECKDADHKHSCKNRWMTTYSTRPTDTTNIVFSTRKCLDSSCSTWTTTTSYPLYMTFSDGGNKEITYKGTSQHANSRIMFKVRPWETAGKPFSIVGLTFNASEPGTYVLFGHFSIDNDKNNVPDKAYAVKFYVTVNTADELKTCNTPANNGYFKAYWNDCLSFAETQLMPFEHIPGQEEAWIMNYSEKGIHFPYVPEWSYVPQKLQVASLNCKAEAISSGGQPGNAYCRPDDVYVPPHTKVTITGGTLYLDSRPAFDDYRVAYARQETYNISHLFFSIQVKACDNVKKIPDTGISLRSPLKINERVDEATSYVFTGNSLRIPAIGLGMETPVPIVHVYYEEGSSDLGWDLSTLGNYVGELEGGAYLPYAGNTALTGHYFSAGVFKNLENLNMGDEIIVFGNDNIKYIYKVVQKFITQPTDVYEMFQPVGERSLTLVTCENYNMVTDEYERRQLVRAVIDSQEPYENYW